MARSTPLAVKFSTEGFDDLRKQLKSAGQSFESAMNKAMEASKEAIAAGKVAAEGTKEWNDAQRDLVRAAKAANNAVAGAFRELNVRTTASIDAQKKAAISAFEAIKKSGVASAQDIANAQASLNKKLKDLEAQKDQTNKNDPEKQRLAALEEAYKSLGVASRASLEAQKEAAKEAFDAIKNSGTATFEELSEARKNYHARITAIDARINQYSPEEVRKRKALEAQQAIVDSYQRLGVQSIESLQRQRQEAIAAYNKIKNSGTASYKDIIAAQKAMDAQLEALDRQIDEHAQGWDKVKVMGKNALDAIKTKLTTLDVGVQNSTEGFTVMKGVLANLISGGIQAGLSAIANLFQSATQAAMGFAQSVIRSGTVTETLKAQLKTIEGSVDGANKAYGQIAEFAKTTPYELTEVTQAYISLANRGIKVTNAELQKVGDLAASQGKPLQQYIEAILDAMTGENERLKEFGIKAKKDGDKVAFTFKGITKEVEASEDAIMKALLSFSELDGVVGGMNERSKTTEGQLSNITDALDQLYVKIFEAIKPAVEAVLGLAIDILTPLGEQVGLFEGLKQVAQEFADFLSQNPAIVDSIKESFQQLLADGVSVAVELAENFLGFLKENPTAIADAIRMFTQLVSGVMGTVVNLAGELLSALQKNPGIIEDTIKAADGLLRVLGKLVEAAIAFGKATSDAALGWEYMLSPEKTSRRQVVNSLGEAGGAKFDEMFAQKAAEFEAAGKPLWFPGNRQKIAEAVAVELMGNPKAYGLTPVVAGTGTTGGGGTIGTLSKPGTVQMQFTDKDFAGTSGFVFGVPGGKITGDQGNQHRGLDVFAPVGTPVLASMSGTIVQAMQGGTVNTEDSNPNKPGHQYQHSVKIKLDEPFDFNGKTIRYMWNTHLTEIAEGIVVGAKVVAGQKLGEVGMAGGAPHLHQAFAEGESFRGNNPLSNRESLELLTAIKNQPIQTATTSTATTTSAAKASPININASNVGSKKGTIPNNRTALTFDDGPDPTWTPQVLDQLKKFGAKATFYVVGDRAKQYPELIKRMIAEGHEVGLHSMSHPNFTKLTNEQRVAEVKRQLELLKEIVPDYTPTSFRFPYGAGSYQGQEAFQQEINKLGLSTVYWSSDTQDWRKETTAQSIADEIMKAGGGDIILMHDALDAKGNPKATASKKAVVDALKIALPLLQQKGIISAPISQLYGLGGGVGTVPSTTSAAASSLKPKQQEALPYVMAMAKNLGVNPRDLLALISFETGHQQSFDPDVMGGKGGNYQGWIQFSPDNRKTYGVKQGQSMAEHAKATEAYLRDRLKRNGVTGTPTIYDLYNAINPGFKRSELDKRLEGDKHWQVADQMLAGGGADAKKLQKEAEKAQQEAEKEQEKIRQDALKRREQSQKLADDEAIANLKHSHEMQLAEMRRNQASEYDIKQQSVEQALELRKLETKQAIAQLKREKGEIEKKQAEKLKAMKAGEELTSEQRVANYAADMQLIDKQIQIQENSLKRTTEKITQDFTAIAEDRAKTEAQRQIDQYVAMGQEQIQLESKALELAAAKQDLSQSELTYRRAVLEAARQQLEIDKLNRQFLEGLVKPEDLENHQRRIEYLKTEAKLNKEIAEINYARDQAEEENRKAALIVQAEYEQLSRLIALAEKDGNVERVKTLKLLQAQYEFEQKIAAIKRQGLPQNLESQAIAAETQLYQRQTDEILRGNIDLGQSFRDLLSGPLTEFFQTAIDGSKSLGDAFSAMAKSILGSLAQIGAELATSSLLNMLGLGNRQQPSSGIGGWIANLFGFGGSALAAASPAGAVGGMPFPFMGKKFAEGGFTGKGGKWQPMGIVHGGEYVLNKEATAAIGLPSLNFMNRFGELPEFALGGYVGNMENRLLSGLNAIQSPQISLPPNSNTPERRSAATTTNTVTVNINDKESRFYRQSRTLAREMASELRAI